MKRCKIVIKDGFLLLTMPNGDIIPMQTDIKISQDMENSTATLTVLVDVTNIKNIDRWRK